MVRRRGARRGVVAALLAAALIVAAPAARAQEGEGDARPGTEAPRGSGLPIPRFASLRASEVFMRAGPGTRYPIEWVYRKRGLPVQIIAEFDAWRRVRDSTGTVGWVHRAMLTGRRTALTTADETKLLRNPEANAPLVARVEPGVVARILACDGPWCRIEVQGLRGWAPRAALWGTFEDERVD